MRLGLAIGGAILALLLAGIAVSAIAPPEAALRIDLAGRFSPPDARHLLGSDELGRDVLSRLALGARTTVSRGALAVIAAFCLGVPLGLAANRSPGSIGRAVIIVAHAFYVLPSRLLQPLWSSRVLMALLSVSCVLPGAFLALAAIAYLGPGDATNVFVLAVFTAPAIAYMLHRIDVLPRDQGRTAMTHARSRGFRLALLATSLLAWAILLESAFDAMGLGVRPPLPSWGAMLAEFSHYALGLSWRAMLPGLCLVLTALGAFLLGDAFQRRGQASW
jgi:peptide/nickel transport system permease protein